MKKSFAFCDVLATITILGAIYSGCLSPAEAQNPTCPTRPVGDSSNACASTAFVQEAISIPLSSGLKTDYPAQAPGGSIVVGANTVTLSPCPLGLAGTDSNHYVYISAGTGTAEAVLITGGTCTSGAQTGTVIFTAANTHSGAWTVSSASAGIDEALRLQGTPVVDLPVGVYLTYAPTTPPAGSTIQCVGGTNPNNTPEPCQIRHQSTNTAVFSCVNDNLIVKGISFTSSVVAVAGSSAIKTTTGCNSFILDDLTAWAFYKNYDFTDCSAGTLKGVNSYTAVLNGIITQSCQGRWIDIFIQNSGGDALFLGVNGIGANAIPFIQGLHIFNNGGWGVHTTAGIDIENFYINFDFLGEVFLDTPIAGGAGSGKCQSLRSGSIEVAGATISFGTNTSAPGIRVSSTSGLPLCINNVSVDTNQGNGVQFDGPYGRIGNSRIFSNGQGAVAGNVYGVKATIGNTFLSDNLIAEAVGAVQIIGGLNSVTGNTISNVNVTTPAIEFIAGASPFNSIMEGNILSNAAGGGLAIRTAAATTYNAPFTNFIVQGSFTFNGTVTNTMYGSALQLYGSTSGTTSIQAAAVAGAGVLRFPAGSTDFSATGGASQVVKQSSAGAALTVGTQACADISNAGTTCPTSPGNGLDISGTTLQITAARRTLPTHQFLTTGTDATYTTPANVLYIKIRLVGGGAGGAGGGSGAPGAGGAGGTTCWKGTGTACTTPLISASGGAAATGASGAPALGGTGIACNINIVGGDGSGGVQSLVGSINGLGGKGGDGMFGGGGGPSASGAGNAGAAFGTGGAGGAATSGGTNNSGSGGGAGGGCEHWISTPAATYVYTIGAAGTAGAAGTNGAAGGAGKIGYITVDEFYN